MSTPSPSELLAPFQSEFNLLEARLTELVKEGAGLLAAGEPAGAVQVFGSALAAVDAFLLRWEEIVQPLPDHTTHLQNIRQLVLDDRGRLWDSIGLAHRSAGQAIESKAAFHRGLALYSGQPSAAKASLLASLASTCAASEEFSEAEAAFQASLSEYDQVIAAFAPFAWAAEMVSLFRSSQLRTLSAAADCALSQGRREICRQRLAEALSLAEQHQVADLPAQLWLKLASHDLRNDPSGEALPRLTAERLRLKGLTHDPAVEVDADCLLADYWIARGVMERGRELLTEALQAAEAAPHRRWIVYTSLAELSSQTGDATGALHYHEAALNEARRMQMPEVIGSVLQNLIPAQIATGDPLQVAQAGSRLEELRQLGQHAPLAAVLQQRALLRLRAHDWDGAWGDLDECDRLAVGVDYRVTTLLGKVAVRREQNRLDEALQLTEAALAGLPAGKALVETRMLLGSFSTLHENAAVLCARLGRGRDAFRWADAGRAVRLQASLSVIPDDFEGARALLAEQNAAAAILCVTGKRTLILGLRPDESDPVVEFVDLGEAEMQSLLPVASSASSWTQQVFASAPALSGRLGLPLSRLARGCRVLYLVPDSRLSFVPFAALEGPDGSRLIDHVAVAFVPSIGMLKHCRARAAAIPGRSCLALGVGSSGPLAFADQARAVASLAWPAQRCLLEDDATPARWLAEARDFAVLHLSVHGQVADGGQLSSSQLALGGDSRLSAAEVAALDGALPAQMVVLNACVSGRFQAPLPGEIGGFWEGFLRAGAATLVATLVYVNPAEALDLILAFYRHWLSGSLTKAEALRQAQLELRRCHPEPEHWATHILVGDGG